MTGTVRVLAEHGPKGKKVVTFAIDWPGWSRGAKTEDDALNVLASYRERYRPVAERAGLIAEFDAAADLEVIERHRGTGSTDFWGISFSPGTEERLPMTEEECEHKLLLLQASWTFFDTVSQSVSAELKKGPRGGGRDRDQIISHTFGTERTQFAVKVGVETPQGVMLTPEGLVMRTSMQFARTTRKANRHVPGRSRF